MLIYTANLKQTYSHRITIKIGSLAYHSLFYLGQLYFVYYALSLHHDLATFTRSYSNYPKMPLVHWLSHPNRSLQCTMPPACLVRMHQFAGGAPDSQFISRPAYICEGCLSRSETTSNGLAGPCQEFFATWLSEPMGPESQLHYKWQSPTWWDKVSFWCMINNVGQ